MFWQKHTKKPIYPFLLKIDELPKLLYFIVQEFHENFLVSPSIQTCKLRYRNEQTDSKIFANKLQSVESLSG